jgi:MazG family protein
VPWEELKARERASVADEPPSLLVGLAKGLDPLSGAQRIQDRVSAVGFDWGNARDALDKVSEEVAEVESAIEAGEAGEIEEELGDLLFSVVNVARLTGGHAMRALQGANRKFTRRFVALETLARERGLDLEAASLEAMDALWDEVKRAPRTRGAAGGEVSTGTDD